MRGLALLAALLLVGSSLVAHAAHGPAAVEDGESAGLLAALLAKWEPRAEIEVIEVHTSTTRAGSWRDAVHADPGYEFHHVRVLVRNVGSVPLPLSTWHFSAEDDMGRNVAAELSMAHHDFDGGALRKGAMREGLVVFELPKGTRIDAMVWQGELTWAQASLPAWIYDDAKHRE